MRFLSNERLYIHTEECLEYLRALGPAASPRAEAPGDCHFYWRGTLSRKPALAVKSFLATQDISRWSIWLWLDGERGYEGHAENLYLRSLMRFVTVKRFDFEQEVKDTPFEEQREVYRNWNNVARSNLARHILLYRYGGLWADTDVMFLRDLGPLTDDDRFTGEFCYRWSASQPYGNSAVMHFRRGGRVAARLLDRCRAAPGCRTQTVFQFAGMEDLDLLVLPCPFFDPLWAHRDGKDRYDRAPFDRFEDFFKPLDGGFRPRSITQPIADFFPGAFAYHWHNCWDLPELENSYFALFDRWFDAVLEHRYGAAQRRETSFEHG